MVDQPFYLKCYRYCHNFCFSSIVSVDETNACPKLVSNGLVSNESILVPTNFLKEIFVQLVSKNERCCMIVAVKQKWKALC